MADAKKASNEDAAPVAGDSCGNDNTALGYDVSRGSVDTRAGSAFQSILRRTQEMFGHLPPDAVLNIARKTMATSSQLYGGTGASASANKPLGRNVVIICQNEDCGVFGTVGLGRFLTLRLGASIGETTADGRYSLTAIDCIGACGQGPAMMVNGDYYDGLDEEKIDGILKKYS